MLVTKMNILGGMNAVIEELGDDNLTEIWLNYYPDGANETDLREIAEDSELFADVVGCFARIMRAVDEEERG